MDEISCIICYKDITKNIILSQYWILGITSLKTGFNWKGIVAKIRNLHSQIQNTSCNKNCGQCKFKS
jgi:hypothetical protein